jgi:hypothetical protein
VIAMHRSLLAGSVSLLAALGLAACTSQTQKCSGGVCDIDLSGVGSKVQLGGEGGSYIELISASGKTAKVKVGKTEGELTVGQPITLDNGTLELVEVEGEDDIQLRVKGSSGDKAPATSTN